MANASTWAMVRNRCSTRTGRGRLILSATFRGSRPSRTARSSISDSTTARFPAARCRTNQDHRLSTIDRRTASRPELGSRRDRDLDLARGGHRRLMGGVRSVRRVRQASISSSDSRCRGPRGGIVRRGGDPRPRPRALRSRDRGGAWRPPVGRDPATIPPAHAVRQRLLRTRRDRAGGRRTSSDPPSPPHRSLLALPPGTASGAITCDGVELSRGSGPLACEARTSTAPNTPPGTTTPKPPLDNQEPGMSAAKIVGAITPVKATEPIGLALNAEQAGLPRLSLTRLGGVVRPRERLGGVSRIQWVSGVGGGLGGVGGGRSSRSR
jgi:hypothetical protein